MCRIGARQDHGDTAKIVERLLHFGRRQAVLAPLLPESGLEARAFFRASSELFRHLLDVYTRLDRRDERIDFPVEFGDLSPYRRRPGGLTGPRLAGDESLRSHEP